MLGWLWLLPLLVTACSNDASSVAPPPEPRPTVYSGWLRVGAATTSRFEAEKLPGTAGWWCSGLADLDDDGRLDVVLVASGRIHIFWNEGAAGWQEQDVAWTSPVRTGPEATTLGCTSGDFMATGRVDLVAVHSEGGSLLVNEGGRRFREVLLPSLTEATGPPTAPWGASTIDANGDGLPDLYVARNLAAGGELIEQFGCLTNPDGTIYCGINGGSAGAPNVLFLNRGNGVFERVTSGAEDPYQTMMAAVFDLDGDGLQDIFSCNDGAQNFFFRNLGGRFEDITSSLGLVANNNCMGVAVGDLDGDGYPDLALSEVGTPRVYLSQRGRFRMIGRERGLNPYGYYGWGIQSEDFDNDGDLDLLLANMVIGGEARRILCANAEPCDLPQEEYILLRNNGEAYFRPELPVRLPGSAELALSENSYNGTWALVTGDVDGDGILDGLVVRFEEDSSQPPGTFYTNAWLLRGRSSSGFGAIDVDVPPGAVVEVCASGGWCRRREMVTAQSFAAILPSRLHFGIRNEAAVTVRIQHPRGTWTDVGSVPSRALVRYFPRRASGPRFEVVRR